MGVVSVVVSVVVAGGVGDVAVDIVTGAAVGANTSGPEVASRVLMARRRAGDPIR